jgi:serine/threonine protein kinase
LVHRDVKPDNILVTPDGIAKLADLGLVKETETDLNLTRTGRGLGTPHFMAPEQFRNAKNADVRCDIYSLGATLYMMVTGELPFKSCTPLDAWMKKSKNDLPPPRKLNPRVTERTDRAIQRAMAAEPTRRPGNCQDFIADLTGPEPEALKVEPETLKVEVEAPKPEMWYLIYKDTQGAVHTVKGTVIGIRRSFKNGELGEVSHIRASRTKTGEFKPLLSHPEFSDLLETIRKSTESTEELPTFSQIASDPTAHGMPVPQRLVPEVAATAKAEEIPEAPARAGIGVSEWVWSVLLLTAALGLGVGLFFALK